MTMNPPPVRGEVWQIRFDPAEGDEIKKVRTAVVISENAVGRLRLKIVVPITEWKPRFANYPWFVYLAPTPTNGLTNDSGADAFQVKSVSETRFLDRLGELTAGNLDDIANGQGDRLPYLQQFYNGADGLDAQVKANEEAIDPRLACTLTFEGLTPRIRVGKFGP